MTRKLFLFAGVAGLALASPAYGEREGKRADRAQASAGEEQKAQRPQRSERQQRAERPQRIEQQRVERPRFERQEVQRAERPRFERQRTERAERPRIERQRTERAERPRIERQRIERAERPRFERQQVQKAERPRIERQRIERAERPRIERQRVERQAADRLERRRTLARDADDGFDERRALRAERRDARARLTAASPRLATSLRTRDVIRPMKLKRDKRFIAVGDRIEPAHYSSYVPTAYPARYVDTPDYFYRYDDDLGYLYRVDRDDHVVRALIPLYGGYGVGDPWPQMYYSSYVPTGYRGYYYDTPDHYYRYDGNGIYQVDAGTQLITALVALLTGQGFGIGQMLPASYGAYNVPMAYRSTYYDRDDAWYRYGDGFIYQVDPYTRRIADRYPIHGAGYDYMVGEPWPVAYPGYNVPYGYQSLYYDTPQAHYRYADGGIYQVDPTTQLIQALVALVSGQQFAVGQPLPAAYGTYNVPYAYRDRYFDSDSDWYRYADGYIYRVDPDDGRIEEAIPVYA